MSQELTLHDKLHLHIFEGKTIAECYLSKDDMEVKARIETVFAKLLEEPITPEKELRNLVMTQFSVSIATAFRDVALTKSLFGNFKKASREYYRYRVIAMLEHAAEQAKDDKDWDTVVKAADKIGKYTRLDQPETEEVPWEELMPPSFEPTNDIEVLGFTRDPDIKNKIKRLTRKYFTAEDATIIE